MWDVGHNSWLSYTLICDLYLCFLVLIFFAIVKIAKKAILYLTIIHRSGGKYPPFSPTLR